MTDTENTDPGQFTPEVRRVLRRTPVAAWRHLAILCDAEAGTRVMSRGDLAAWLRSSDLPQLADEAEARRVKPGELLALIVGDEPHFVVIQARSPRGSK